MDKNEKHFFDALNDSIENFKKIISKISKKKLENSCPFIIRIINLYNPFPEISFASKWVTMFNSALKAFADSPFVTIIDIDKTFKDYEEEYLSIDRMYPNDIGHERIAEKLHQSGYGTLFLKVKEKKSI